MGVVSREHAVGHRLLDFGLLPVSTHKTFLGDLLGYFPASSRSKPKAADAALVPAEVMGELVTQGSLDLAGKEVAVVAEVALQRVAIDHDPVLVAFAGDTVPVVHAVGAMLGAEIGDDDRDVLEHLLKFLRQRVDGVGDEGFELVEVRGVGHASNRRDLGASECSVGRCGRCS